jgi:hypothetical protein
MPLESLLRTWETPNADVQQPEDLQTPCAPACVLCSSSYDHYVVQHAPSSLLLAPRESCRRESVRYPPFLELMTPHTKCCLHLQRCIATSVPLFSPANADLAELAPHRAYCSSYAPAAKVMRWSGWTAGKQLGDSMLRFNMACCACPEMTAGSRGTGPFTT